MSRLGIPESDIRAALAPLRGVPPESRDAMLETYAAGVWSVLAEPGDGTAGAVRGAVGATGALRLLLENTAPEQVAEICRERGVMTHDDPAAAAEAWRAGADRWRPRLKQVEVQRAFSQAARFDVGLAVPADQDWPTDVDDLGEYAPAALWLRGDRARLAGAGGGIALVGARAATGYGEHVTAEFAGGLADRGITVVSGGAYGIDGVAHRAALAGEGSTVAVMAGGLDRFYPAGHEQLLGRVVDRGLVVAEVPCGTAPTRWRFLARNRVIAALAEATVVVEAGWRSGSLNTAHHALSLGRAVGVVPGPITSAASTGCHRLLRDKPTTLVSSIDEVVALVRDPGVLGPIELEVARADPESARMRVLDALSSRSARSAELLANTSGLALDRVRSELGLLELDGLVRESPRGWVRRAEVARAL